jgi:hypothetical protein
MDVSGQPRSEAHVVRRVVLAQQQRTRVSIHVAPRLLEPYAAPSGRRPSPPAQAEIDRLRLQSSVKDLAQYLERLSGAAVPIVVSAPDGNTTLPILIAELATARFGEPKVSAPGRQGLRVVVSPSAIGLIGESDLAASYAIYELLDRLGCRWFMPGPYGEEAPRQEVLSLPEGDDSLAPSTWFRDIRHADEDYRRRNRLGGLPLAAGHQLERWVTAAQREQHPDWRATVNGQPDRTRLRWDSPELATAIARAIEASFAKTGSSTASVSPGDGGGFDERPGAAGPADWDPHTHEYSLTDRLLLLANRIADDVSADYADARLGLLVYDRYARPPLVQPVHRNLVPVLAPINYCRTHPLSEDTCPGARDLRDAIAGWASRSEVLAYRSYTFNLAEPSVPFPMLARLSAELPFFFAHKTRYFQPETLPNFETALPALYLGIRLAWNAQRRPEQVLNELFDRFYGDASKPTRAYLEYLDDLWTHSRDYAGGSLGYGARFTPAALVKARQLLNLAKAECRMPTENWRIDLLEHSLAQFESFMKLYWDLREGRLAQLDSDATAWKTRAAELSEQFATNYAFGRTSWAKGQSVPGYFFERFLAPAYREAARIAREQALVVATPLCEWRFATVAGPLPGADLPAVPLARTTNSCRESWSALGLHDYFGGVRYETEVELEPSESERPDARFLWVSSVDGIVQAWVNGRQAPLKDAPGRFQTETHFKGVTFDVSGALRSGANVVTLAVQRTRLAEVGGGGIVGPAFMYRARTAE